MLSYIHWARPPPPTPARVVSILDMVASVLRARIQVIHVLLGDGDSAHARAHVLEDVAIQQVYRNKGTGGHTGGGCITVPGLVVSTECHSPRPHPLILRVTTIKCAPCGTLAVRAVCTVWMDGGTPSGMSCGRATINISAT